jgi:hypothetical protein
MLAVVAFMVQTVADFLCDDLMMSTAVTASEADREDDGSLLNVVKGGRLCDVVVTGNDARLEDDEREAGGLVKATAKLIKLPNIST